MEIAKFDNGLSIWIEHTEKQARLVIYKDGVENVCRKSTIRKLRQFIQSDEQRLFKGRLQLHRDINGMIAVDVKGKIAGVVPAEHFLATLINN
jgi:hypothetical protein